MRRVSSPSAIRMIKSRRMRLAWYVTRIEVKRNECWILVGNQEEKEPLQKQRRRWLDNIEMDLREIE
jgi:hypothetical protein